MNSIKFTATALLFLALPAFPSFAQDTDPVLIESAKTDSIDATESRQSVREYLDHISELEKLHGPYNAQVGEQLLGLGLLYRTQGEYKNAGEVLNQSLHIKKVNEGIQSMSQVPILEALIQTNTAAKNWDELNRNFHLLLWLYQRNYDPGDPEMLPIFEMVGKWKLWAYTNKALSEDLATTLSDLANMTKSSVGIMEEMYGENDPRLIVPLKVQAMARYMYVQQAAATPLDDYQGSEPRTTFYARGHQAVCRIINTTRGPMQVCEFVPIMEEISNPGYYTSKQYEKNLTVAKHMNSVKGVLNKITRISAANPSIPAKERANALVNLGDWHFMYDQKKTAFEKYRQAHDILLTDAEGQDYIDKLFGEPKMLPSLILNAQDVESDTEAELEEPFVKLSFDVKANGKTRQIKVVDESDPHNITARKIARANIKNSLFRPRFIDGEPVDTEQTTIRLSGAILEDRSVLESPHDSVLWGSRTRR